MPRDCHVCLIEHDPEIHAATLRVREWFRLDLQLTLNFEVPKPAKSKKPQRPFQTPATKGFKVNDVNRWALKL